MRLLVPLFKGRLGRKPSPGQGSLSFDEEAHPREAKGGHDDKYRAGEFVPRGPRLTVPVRSGIVKQEGHSVQTGDTTVIPIPIASVTDPTGKTQIPAEIPVPLENAAGRVFLSPQGYVGIEVAVDAAMRGVGVTRIDSIEGVEDAKGQPILRVKTNKGTAGISLATRPELKALLDNRVAINRAIDATRERYHKQEKQDRERADEPLLAEMREREAKIAATIPTGNVRVEVTQTSSADGDPLYHYEAEGVNLDKHEDDMVHHGTAAAIHPGALAHFASTIVLSIPRSMLEKLKVEQKTQREGFKDKARQTRQELTQTPVPAAALDAYRRYRGSAEAAWDAEDEGAWALINKWLDYIEAQNLR